MRQHGVQPAGRVTKCLGQWAARWLPRAKLWLRPQAPWSGWHFSCQSCWMDLWSFVNAESGWKRDDRFWSQTVRSLYDHLHSPSSPTSIEDRRTSIDVVIIRESVKQLQAFVRWVPTDRMLADGLTKDSGGPIDLLRACIKRSCYQISPEETVLEYQALERDRRLLDRQKGKSQ